MKTPPKALTLALCLAGAALLAACGSNTTTTVTVTRTVAANTTATSTSSATTTSRSHTRTSTSTSSSGAPARSTSSTTTTAPTATTSTSTTTTRTETGPAFVVTTPSGGGALAGAIALLSRKGFSAIDSSSYQPDDTLRVLIGRAAAGERAFFFDDTTFLGTDASVASAHITVFAHSDTEVVLSYSIYRPGAQASSGVRRVHFALDMGMLNALDPIPSVSQRR